MLRTSLFLYIAILVSRTAPAAESFLIVPGESIGVVLKNTTLVDLKKIAGISVKSKSIDVGEGEKELGNVVCDARGKELLAILWKAGKGSPSRITVYDSRYKTKEGVGLGTTLKQMEQLNGKPFTLAGFGWDYAGTVFGFNKGKLDYYTNPVGRVILRLSPDSRDQGGKKYMTVVGDKEFSSSVQAMQDLNPKVYQILMDF